MTVSETIQEYYVGPWIPPCPDEGRTQWTKVEIVIRDKQLPRIWVNGRRQQ